MIHGVLPPRRPSPRSPAPRAPAWEPYPSSGARGSKTCVGVGCRGTLSPSLPPSLDPLPLSQSLPPCSPSACPAPPPPRPRPPHLPAPPRRCAVFTPWQRPGLACPRHASLAAAVRRARREGRECAFVCLLVVTGGRGCRGGAGLPGGHIHTHWGGVSHDPGGVCGAVVTGVCVCAKWSVSAKFN